MARPKYAVGEIVDKNIKYRGEMQYSVEIRRKGFSVHETFLTLDDARIFRDETFSKLRGDRYDSPAALKKTTFSDLVDKWITENPNASRTDTNRIKNLGKFPFSQLSLRDLKSSHFASFRNERLNGDTLKGIKPRANDTVRNDLVAASKLYRLAITEWGFENLKNPLDAVKKPSSVERDRRLLAVEGPHLAKALEGGRNKIHKSIVNFALETAMRQGEIAHLVWSRVDLVKGTVKLRAIDTKTKKARMVTLTDEAIKILRDIEPLKLPNMPVFHSSQNAIDGAWDHIRYRARKSYEEACEKRGIAPDNEVFSDLHFHDLRHEATSRLVARLGNLSHVQSISGHKTLSQLQRYTHLLTDEVREALNRTKRV